MRCKTCDKKIRWRDLHHLQRNQCAKCHYLGQISAYPGSIKQTFCKRGHLIINKKWNGKIRRDCTICQVKLRKQKLEILA